ncbi:unnamed protein product [Effrenium voratum]|uniref:Uncharacterized protein n=1 Tax=Effrenium voratum TaxID=2562239 RepID=A0AA36JGJ5_9DINO|nr:unnamed protein product [Effrenium voratum]CAJ1457660.1 unnamed protein product [Effrenium voratum]
MAVGACWAAAAGTATWPRMFGNTAQTADGRKGRGPRGGGAAGNLLAHEPKAEPPDLLAKAREAVGVHVLLEACPVSPKLKVLTIRGSMWQKRQAVRAILERLVPREGCLSLLLPSAGFTALQAPGLWEGLKLLGAQLHVPEPLGERFLALAEGNPEQILSTATRVNTALQDLADHGRLLEAHFSEDPGAAPPQVLQVPQQLLHPQKLQEQTQRVLQERFQPLAGRSSQPPSVLKKPTLLREEDAKSQGQLSAAGTPLRLLLPKRLADFLVPDHLAAVARRCAVRIDVAPSDGGCQVLLTGGLAEVAMATLQLQMRCAQRA